MQHAWILLLVLHVGNTEEISAFVADITIHQGGHDFVYRGSENSSTMWGGELT